MSVHVEKSGPVTSVVLHRPDVRNAVEGPTAAALAEAFRVFDADDTQGVAVLFGEGGVFCSGADLLFNARATTTRAYDALGRVIRITDAAGNQTTAAYDSLGQATRNCDPDLGCWGYTYDAVGNQTSVKDAKGQTINMTYDVLGRLRTKTGGFSWTYDEAGHGSGIGRLTTATFPGGSDSFTYDVLGRVSSTQYCDSAPLRDVS